MWVKCPRHTLAASIKRLKIKASTLNLVRDYQKLWRLVKQLNDENY